MHFWCLGAFRTFKIGFVVENRFILGGGRCPGGQNTYFSYSGSRCLVSGLRSQFSSLRSQVSDLRSQVSGLRPHVLGFTSQVPGLGSQVFGLRSQVSGPWVSLGCPWDSLGVLREVHGVHRRSLGHGSGNPEVLGFLQPHRPSPRNLLDHDLSA